MKKLFTILLFMLSVLTVAAQSISSVRTNYRTANKDSVSCAALYEKVSKSPPENQVLTAYNGAVTMMYAGFIKDKAQALKLFKSGRLLLEEAIKEDPDNPEYRLLRFSIQCHAPKVLGYNKDLKEDKKVILDQYPTLTDSEVKTSIRSLLLNSKELSSSEKEILK